MIDTENGRALHKADDYTFKHTALDEPFTPERYSEAVKAVDSDGFPVAVIDSGSHVYEGVGGVLDMQAAEFTRMGERDGARMSSWIEPKRRHKRFVQDLLRARAHVILCLRAEDKIEIVKDENNRTVVRPKESLIGADGWIPICEKRLPFEATISLLLTADAPGVPKPIKLERRHEALVPLDRPLDEEVGKALGLWAAGRVGIAAPSPSVEPEPLTINQLNGHIAASGIDPKLVGEVGRRLFPDADGARALSDEQRGAVWAEVAKEAVLA